MTRYDELQQTHQRLLKRMNDLTDEDAFRREVQHYVARMCEEAVDVPRPRERDQLRANLRYWASYLYDTTGTYPKTTMRPARSPRPESESAPPLGTANPAFRFTTIGLSVILMLFLILIGLIFLVRQGTQNEVEAMNEMIQATNRAIAATVLATPSLRPTHTPMPADAVAPSRTPVPTETLTAAPAERQTPLTVDYQVLTQGPSPFDPAVWVMQLKLVGMGGNGHYIYWLNGRQLDGNEINVQGTRCESQTIILGVTSNDQAGKREVTLHSPLRDCPTASPE